MSAKEAEKAYSKHNSFWKKISNRFLSGLLILVPLGLIVFLIIWLFEKAGDFMRPAVESFLEWEKTVAFLEWAKADWLYNNDGEISVTLIRIISLIIMLILIYLIGWLGSNYLGRKIISFFEGLLRKVPIVKQLYSGAQQIIKSITGKGNFSKAAFREVVVVEFPRKGMRTLAFITNEIKTTSGQKFYNLYIPSTPFMTGGYFEILTEEEITRTKLSVDEALQMVLSGGMISPEIISIEENKEKIKRITTYEE